MSQQCNVRGKASRSSKQHGSGRERLRQTCTTRRARITTSCRSLKRRTARTRNKPRPSTATRRHRFWRSNDKPAVQLDRINESQEGHARCEREAINSAAGESHEERQHLRDCKAEASVEHPLAVQDRPTIFVQDIETRDSWMWAPQDSGQWPLLMQAMDTRSSLSSSTCRSRTTRRRHSSFLELREHKCSRIWIVSREFRSTVTQ